MLEIKEYFAKVVSGLYPAEAQQLKIELSIPTNSQHADLSSNVAFLIAASQKENQLAIAQNIIKSINHPAIASADIGGNGFINLTVRNSIIEDYIVKQSLEVNYGSNQLYQNKKVQVEFISANPTGPIHIGNARGGPLGDGIANLVKFCGGKVEREFYINDIGGQIDRFVASLWYLIAPNYQIKADLPPDGYIGEEIKNLAQTIAKKLPPEGSKINIKELKKTIGRLALENNIDNIKNSVSQLGIKFDQFIYQSDIAKNTPTIIDQLKAKQVAINKDQAVWFSPVKGVDLTDRETVLIKSDGQLTYFADDIAYHIDKFITRKFDLVVDVWGANHHGHIKRMESALAVLGIKPNRLKIILYQYVRLKNGDQIEKMAKRRGSYITLDQVLAKIPADVFRFFMLEHSPSSHLDFDFQLALDSSQKNPLYYCYYAIARINSIEKKLGRKRVEKTIIDSTSARSLALKIIEFPTIIEKASEDFLLNHLVDYLKRLAGAVHNYYEQVKIIGEDSAVEKFLLLLAARNVLTLGLNIIGINPPQKLNRTKEFNESTI